MDICTSLNISIGRVMKNPEMLKFVTGHFKSKKMCKDAVKKSRYLLRYVSINIRLNKCVIKLF